MNYKYFFILLFIPLFLSCESNPVGDTPLISGGNQSISGRVLFGNNLNPSNVFVWLEGFDLATRTDNQGRFRLTLPPPAAQPGDGVTGTFRVFFYMANFRLKSIEVVVRNGEFLLPSDLLNDSGELRSNIFLNQLVTVRSTINPEQIQINQPGVILTRFFLSTAETDTVFVIYPRNVQGVLNPLIFKNVMTDAALVFSTTNAGINTEDTLKIVNNDPEEVVLLVNGSSSDFSPGIYEAVPYLFVLQENIPPALVRKIGTNVSQLGTEYLKIPFLRESNQLTVSVE